MKRLLLIFGMLIGIATAYAQYEDVLPMKSSSLAGDTIRVVKDGGSALMLRSTLLADVNDSLAAHLTDLLIHQDSIDSYASRILVLEGLVDVNGDSIVSYASRLAALEALEFGWDSTAVSANIGKLYEYTPGEGVEVDSSLIKDHIWYPDYYSFPTSRIDGASGGFIFYSVGVLSSAFGSTGLTTRNMYPYTTRTFDIGSASPTSGWWRYGYFQRVYIDSADHYMATDGDSVKIYDGANPDGKTLTELASGGIGGDTVTLASIAPLLTDTVPFIIFGAGHGQAADSIYFVTGEQNFGEVNVAKDSTYIPFFVNIYMSAGDSVRFNAYYGDYPSTKVDSLFTGPVSCGPTSVVLTPNKGHGIPYDRDFWIELSGTQPSNQRPNKWRIQANRTRARD